MHHVAMSKGIHDRRLIGQHSKHRIDARTEYRGWEEVKREHRRATIMGHTLLVLERHK